MRNIKIDERELDLIIRSDVDEAYSRFANGYRIYDKDVGKMAFKHLSIFDRLFRPDRTAMAVMATHTLMAEAVQTLSDKEES